MPGLTEDLSGWSPTMGSEIASGQHWRRKRDGYEVVVLRPRQPQWMVSDPFWEEGTAFLESDLLENYELVEDDHSRDQETHD